MSMPVIVRCGHHCMQQPHVVMLYSVDISLNSELPTSSSSFTYHVFFGKEQLCSAVFNYLFFQYLQNYYPILNVQIYSYTS